MTIRNRLTPKQQLELDQVLLQKTRFTMLGAAGGAAASMLSHYHCPRSRITHAWQAIGNAALGSYVGALVHSARMEARFREANGRQ